MRISHSLSSFLPYCLKDLFSNEKKVFSRKRCCNSLQYFANNSVFVKIFSAVRNIYIRGNFKSLQKCLKILAEI